MLSAAESDCLHAAALHDTHPPRPAPADAVRLSRHSRALLIHPEQIFTSVARELGTSRLDWNEEDGDQDEVVLVLGGDHSDSDQGDRGQTCSSSSGPVQILLPRQEIENIQTIFTKSILKYQHNLL